MRKEDLPESIKKAWKDDYFVSLAIYQHLAECKEKFEMVKNHAVSPMSKEELQFELDKELADLKMLLDLYVKDDMMEKRVNKFLENENGD